MSILTRIGKIALGLVIAITGLFAFWAALWALMSRPEQSTIGMWLLLMILGFALFASGYELIVTPTTERPYAPQRNRTHQVRAVRRHRAFGILRSLGSRRRQSALETGAD